MSLKNRVWNEKELPNLSTDQIKVCFSIWLWCRQSLPSTLFIQ